MKDQDIFAGFASFAWLEFEGKVNTPMIPNAIYDFLPEILKKGCDVLEKGRDKDVFLTSALSVLSGCLNNVEGIYNQQTVFPNMFCFIIAPPASGKGNMIYAKALVKFIQETLKKDSDLKAKTYNEEHDRYKVAVNKGKSIELPIKPKYKILVIPANGSASAIIQHLNDTDRSCIICETEADTMSNSFKQDWGGYSEILRKAFHHEPISISRRTNNEYFEIACPKLSIAITGTPSQVTRLIHSAEDGLFSRFIFYTFSEPPKWKNVFKQTEINLTDYFDDLAKEVLNINEFLEKNPTKFTLTLAQQASLNSAFEKLLAKTSSFVHENISSSTKRMGLIVYKIAMTLTALRKAESKQFDTQIECTNDDFEIAMYLGQIYLLHAIVIYKELPKKEINNGMENFFKALPNIDFSRKEALEIGLALNLKERSIGTFLRNLVDQGFLIKPSVNGVYRKK